MTSQTKKQTRVQQIENGITEFVMHSFVLSDMLETLEHSENTLNELDTRVSSPWFANLPMAQRSHIFGLRTTLAENAMGAKLSIGAYFLSLERLMDDKEIIAKVKAIDESLVSDVATSLDELAPSYIKFYHENIDGFVKENE